MSDAGSIRGLRPTSPRWQGVRDRNNEGARLSQAGDLPGSIALLAEAVALTLVDDVDAEGLDLRARALFNLSAAHEQAGSFAEALRLSDQGIAAAQAALSLTGDDRGTHAVLLNGRLSRAQTLLASDRHEDAFAELDAVEHELSSPADSLDTHALLRFSLHNTRTGALILRGQLRDAEREAQRALSAAIDADPSLAAHAYANLGAIAQRTGDERAEEYLRLASDLASGDASAAAAARQLSEENLARAALDAGRLDEAERRFIDAEQAARASGLHPRAAACGTGRAAVLLQRGHTDQAAAVLRGILAELSGTGAVSEQHEAHLLLAMTQHAQGHYAEALESHGEARRLARSVHERCLVDLRRAETYAEWSAHAGTPALREDGLRTALRLAVPVLLATEALRDEAPPGDARERWIGQVSAPARELAFRLAATVRDAELLHALIENTAASATLRPGAVADQTGPRFALPPRVRAIPGAAPALEEWIIGAEEEYGIRVRGDEVVPAW